MKYETYDTGQFGRAIRKKRRQARIGLRQFAERIGISATYLSRIEHGLDRPPAVEKIARMAEALGIDSEMLFEIANKSIKAFDRQKQLGKGEKESFDKTRMPPDIKEAYAKYPKYIPEFMRVAKKKKLSDKDWQKFIEDLEKKNNDKSHKK